MKRILLLLFTVISMLSCSDDTLEQQPLAVEVTASSTLRTTLENLRKFAAPTVKSSTESKSNNMSDLCFQFIYPFVLQYNDSTKIPINSFDELLSVILSETVSYHIVGIGFPFEVVCHLDNTIYIIDDEAEFSTLIQNCNYDGLSPKDVLNFLSDCFTINYPVSFTINESEITLNSEEELISYFAGNLKNIKHFNFQYPFSVTLTVDGSAVVIEDDYEVIHLITNTCKID